MPFVFFFPSLLLWMFVPSLVFLLWLQVHVLFGSQCILNHSRNLLLLVSSFTFKFCEPFKRGINLIQIDHVMIGSICLSIMKHKVVMIYTKLFTHSWANLLCFLEYMCSNILQLCSHSIKLQGLDKYRIASCWRRGAFVSKDSHHTTENKQKKILS